MYVWANPTRRDRRARTHGSHADEGSILTKEDEVCLAYLSTIHVDTALAETKLPHQLIPLVPT